MRRNRHAVNGYGDASGGNNCGLMIRRTALTAMEVNGSEELVSWDNKYIRVALGKVWVGYKTGTGGKRTQSAPAKSISRTTF